MHTKRFVTLLMVFCCSLCPISASEVRLSDVEQYLNAIRTLEAGFKQWDPNGALTTGHLMLKRPGFIRMDYKAPSPLLIVADGENIFFIDRSTQDVSHAPIYESPAAFLLDPKIDFLRRFQVENFEDKGDQILLTIRRKDSPDLGSLTLVFQKGPLRLIQWIVKDAQNTETTVTLENVRMGTRLNERFFDANKYLK